MVVTYLGLGSNQGDRPALIGRAVEALRRLPDSTVEAVSSVREYAAVGGPPQGAYLNAAVALRTALPPRSLLAYLQAIEHALGRQRAREVRWGPRPMDLDLLLYGDAILQAPDLIIPHPRLAERRFVLEPLAEIAPAAWHPQRQCTVRALLDHLAERAVPGRAA